MLTIEIYVFCFLNFIIHIEFILIFAEVEFFSCPPPGDKYLKPWIIPDPEVKFVLREKNDECLILASDGLWDVITNEEVCDFARKRILFWHKKNGTNVSTGQDQGVDPAAHYAAECLTKIAHQRGSKDNISVIVIDLKAQRQLKKKT